MENKLSRNEWIGVGVGVALIGYTLFGGTIHQVFTQSSNQSNLANAMNAQESADTPNVKTEDIVVGTGEELQPGMLVDSHYILSLPDGTVIQNSREVGGDQPFQFIYGVGQLIPGWEMGVEGMRVGGKRIITIPPELAYGAQGAGPIPPNSTLIFEVEILGVEQLQ